MDTTMFVEDHGIFHVQIDNVDQIQEGELPTSSYLVITKEQWDLLKAYGYGDCPFNLIYGPQGEYAVELARTR
jgi:hypothetical protein